MEQKKTVLIVEDEKNIVDIIRFNLQRTGYDTLEAYDGEAGLAMAREKKPDLILLDGGKGHVGAIRPLLREMGIDVPVYGMVKDDKHRTRAITEDGGEIAIQSTRAVFTLVSSIQDEVHRFAITYHHQHHTKTHVEGFQRFGFVQVCCATNKRNNGRHTPTAHFNLSIHVIRQGTIEVFRDTAARNMSQATNRTWQLAKHCAHRFHINSGRFKQRIQNALTIQRILWHA